MRNWKVLGYTHIWSPVYPVSFNEELKGSRVGRRGVEAPWVSFNEELKVVFDCNLLNIERLVSFNEELKVTK